MAPPRNRQAPAAVPEVLQPPPAEAPPPAAPEQPPPDPSADESPPEASRATEPPTVPVAKTEPSTVPAEASEQPEIEPSRGAVDLGDAQRALAQLVQSATRPPPSAPKYVASVRHFIGGERGYIEPGDPIVPSDADLPQMLAQQTIREA